MNSKVFVRLMAMGLALVAIACAKSEDKPKSSTLPPECSAEQDAAVRQLVLEVAGRNYADAVKSCDAYLARYTGDCCQQGTTTTSGNVSTCTTWSYGNIKNKLCSDARREVSSKPLTNPSPTPTPPEPIEERAVSRIPVGPIADISKSDLAKIYLEPKADLASQYGDSAAILIEGNLYKTIEDSQNAIEAGRVSSKSTTCVYFKAAGSLAKVSNIEELKVGNATETQTGLVLKTSRFLMSCFKMGVNATSLTFADIQSAVGRYVEITR